MSTQWSSLQKLLCAGEASKYWVLSAKMLNFEMCQWAPTRASTAANQTKAEVGAQHRPPLSRAKTEKGTEKIFCARSIFHFISNGKRCTATSFNYDFVSPAKTQKTGFLFAIPFLLFSVGYWTDKLQALNINLNLKGKEEEERMGEKNVTKGNGN